MRHVTWGAWRWVTAVALSVLSLPAGEVLAAQLGQKSFQVQIATKSRTIFGVRGNTTDTPESKAPNPEIITFITYDNDDQAGGDATMMYAPLRSIVNSAGGKANWHLLDINSNQAFRLRVEVSPESLGDKSLQKRLYGWFGGIYSYDKATKLSTEVVARDTEDGDLKTDDWKFLHDRSWTMGTSCPICSVPFSYRVDAGGIPEGNYTGIVKYTLETL